MTGWEQAAVTVRQATPGDTMTMADIRARSWRAAYEGLIPEATIAYVEATQAAWAGRMSELLADSARSTRMFVATVEDCAAGFAIWWPSADADATPDTADVPAVYLEPDAFGRGIGRRLFAAVVEDIRGHGFAVATLWVLETNERARRFYEAAGWRPDGAIKDDARPGAVLREVRYRSPALDE